jgi:hypothetical protein
MLLTVMALILIGWKMYLAELHRDGENSVGLRRES